MFTAINLFQPQSIVSKFSRLISILRTNVSKINFISKPSLTFSSYSNLQFMKSSHTGMGLMIHQIKTPPKSMFTSHSRSFSRFNKKNNFTKTKSPFIEKVREKQLHVEESKTIDANSTEVLKNVVTETKTTKEVIEEDSGLKEFVNKVIITTGGVVVVSCSTAYLLSRLPLSEEILIGSWTVGAIGMVTSIFGFTHMTTYTSHTKMIKNKELYHYTENSTGRKVAFGAFVGSATLTLVIPMAIMNSYIVLISVVVSGVIMGISAKFALTRINGSLLTYQAPLMIGLVGMLVMGFTAIGAQLIIGPNVFSEVFMQVEPYIGITLFTFLTAVDIHKAVEHYKRKDADHLGISLHLYLDFLNILIRVLELMARALKRALKKLSELNQGPP